MSYANFWVIGAGAGGGCVVKALTAASAVARGQKEKRRRATKATTISRAPKRGEKIMTK